MHHKRRLSVSDAKRYSMPDISQPVPMSFVIETIAAILFLVAVGIVGVKMGKRKHEKG